MRKKIPHVDALYWAMIISANTIGETAGDLLSMTLNLGYLLSTAVLIGLFFALVGAEVGSSKQRRWLYWMVIISSSTAGTTLSDFITRSLKLGYGWGSLLIITVLTAIFAVWRMVAPKMSVDDALDRKTEFLYWLAILASSTLGTAFGDFISNGTPLGFGGGTLVLVGALLVIVALTLLTKLPRVICYWLAIIVTHPLGATMGDYMTKDEGLNLGNVVSTILLVSIFLMIVGVSVLSRRRSQYTLPKLGGIS